MPHGFKSFNEMSPEERRESLTRAYEAMFNSPDYTMYGRAFWTQAFDLSPEPDTGMKVTHRPDGGIAEVVIYPEKE